MTQPKIVSYLGDVNLRGENLSHLYTAHPRNRKKSESLAGDIVNRRVWK
jgi:hypothetical protein